tara:strand:+ start:3 stop:1271 length:1269 start_codon:yes stop_codon:yes gene_type:complete
MSHNEYQNYIDYLKSEKITKKNIVKYIDMYEKYTLKRLREIVKHHNKNVRNYAKNLKDETIKNNIIKVTDFKTKDSLVSRMKQGQKYHKEFIIIDKSKDQDDYDQLSDRFYKEYSKLVKQGKKEDAKQHLNAKTEHLKLIKDSFPKIKSVLSNAEIKADFRKRAKADMKPAKQSPKIKGISAEGQAQFEKIVKSADPKQSKTALKQLISKYNTPEKQEKLVKKAVELKNKKVKASKSPTKVQQFLIKISKSDNPKKLLEAMFKKYSKDQEPKPAPAPKKVKLKITKTLDPQPKQMATSKGIVANPKYVEPQSKESLLQEFKKVGDRGIDDIQNKIEKDKKFGLDFRKFNMTRKKIYDEMTNVAQYPKSKFNNKSTLNKMFMSEYADVIINLANDYIELNEIKEVHVMKDGVIMQDKKMKAKK